MNCAQFRRILMEAPSSQNKAWLEHASSCTACATEYVGALSFEAKLLQALRVPVPDDLESRIRHSSWTSPRRR